MFSRATLACLVLTLTMAGVAAAQASPPEALDEFSDSPVDAASIRLCWASEGADEVDSWTLSMARGTTPPPAGTPGTEVPGRSVSVCHVVGGLAPGVPYSFALVGHNAAGDGRREVHTAAARAPGAFVRERSGTRRLPGSNEYGTIALGVVRATGRIHAAFMDRRSRPATASPSTTRRAPPAGTGRCRR